MLTFLRRLGMVTQTKQLYFAILPVLNWASWKGFIYGIKQYVKKTFHGVASLDLLSIFTAFHCYCKHTYSNRFTTLRNCLFNAP